MTGDSSGLISVGSPSIIGMVNNGVFILASLIITESSASSTYLVSGSGRGLVGIGGTGGVVIDGSVTAMTNFFDQATGASGQCFGGDHVFTLGKIR